MDGMRFRLGPSVATVKSVSESGSRITIDAEAGIIFGVGDMLTFEDVNAVNPTTTQSVGILKEFAITQSTMTKGDHADAIHICPSLIGPGSPYQNVDSLPTKGAVIRFVLFMSGISEPEYGSSGDQKRYRSQRLQ